VYYRDYGLSDPTSTQEEHTMSHATADELRAAANAGRSAYDAQAPNAPALSLTLHGLLTGAPVGEPRTMELMRAFTTAYQAEVQA
jgi:hypothetical protein